MDHPSRGCELALAEALRDDEPEGGERTEREQGVVAVVVPGHGAREGLVVSRAPLDRLVARRGPDLVAALVDSAGRLVELARHLAGRGEEGLPLYRTTRQAGDELFLEH